MILQTTEALLATIRTSDLSVGTKAVAELEVRHSLATNRLNRYLLILTIVASISTAIQASPIVVSWFSHGAQAPCQTSIK